MHASPTLSLRHLLSPLVIAALLAVAPCALAKKDLFATEPGAKHSQAVEQLVSTSSSTPAESKTDDKATSESAKPIETITNSTQTQTLDAKKEAAIAKEPSVQKESSINKEPSTPKDSLTSKESSTNKEPATTNSTAAKEEPSAFDAQLARLKRNLIRTKNDLFGSKPSVEKKAVATTTQTIEPQLGDNSAHEEDAKTEVATISTTEAAQRAQTFAEGQVINVRKYYEETQPRYAVKLLQKNGRMKTINLDAVNGALIEEKSVEDVPQ